MKVLLLCPSFYTLKNTVKAGFEILGYKVYHHDFRNHLSQWQQKLNTQMFRFPDTYRQKWEAYFMPLINRKHIEVFENQSPDLVFIYNNEMLLPETVEYFKSQNAKIMFILGDSPYYTPTNRYYMALLFLADLIISPDSFWAEQLKLLGIENVVVDFPGYDEEPYKNINITERDKEKYNFDIFFVGTGYVDNWGYKRALFLNHFTSVNFKLFGGRHFKRWFKFFPELEKKFELKNGHIPLEELVKMHKCAKLYPVDANPAILHGVHLRVFDTIAMGVLPLVEYRKDLEHFFKGVQLPLIRSYRSIADLATTYIINNEFREKTLFELRDYLKDNYSAHIALKRILEKLI